MARNKKIMKYLPPQGPYGFDDLMHDMLKNNETVNVKTLHGYWLDIGRPDDYMQAIEEFEKQKHLFINE